MRQHDGRGFGGARPGASFVQRQAAGSDPGKRTLVEQAYGQGSPAPVQQRPAPGAAAMVAGLPARVSAQPAAIARKPNGTGVGGGRLGLVREAVKAQNWAASDPPGAFFVLNGCRWTT